MKLSRSVAVFSLVLAFALVGVMQADARCPGKGACHGMGPVWFSLDDGQKAKAKELMTEFMKEKEALRAEVGKKKIELMELTSKDKLDDSAIEKKMEELWAAKDKMKAAKREMSKEFLSILTPEQKKDLGPLWMGLGGKGFGMGYGRGCGHGKWRCPGMGRGKGAGKGYGPHGSGSKCPYMKDKNTDSKEGA